MSTSSMLKENDKGKRIRPAEKSAAVFFGVPFFRKAQESRSEFWELFDIKKVGTKSVGREQWGPAFQGI